MSTAREIVDALFETLAEERAAVRALDVKGVARATARKEALAEALSGVDAASLSALAGDIAALRAELRRNAVLVAHARACVAEALDMVAPREGNVRRGSLRAQV
ncbi:MAG: hypothetical protein KF819_07145 [Labilithrix sp.]|nr:hypothetical protein [Labilithrix sp.]